MMLWIARTSLTARRAVLVAAATVMALGAWALRHAEVDALPEFGPTTVQVQIEALGLSAEEVEQLITVPMEQDLLDGVAWLDSIESKSVPGLSSITMLFEPGTDLYRARQVVQERISQAAGLPQVSKPPQMLQPSSAVGRTAMISLSSKTIDPLEIGVLARWTIRPALMAVPGVSNVAIWGQRERQLQVQVDPTKLRDKDVSLQQVIQSAGNALWVSPLTFLEASSPGTGGFIDGPAQRIGIQHNLPILKPADLGNIAIDETSGALTLGDVATIVEDHQPLIGDALLTGAGAGEPGFMLVVDKLPYANTADVTRGIEETMKGLQPGLVGLDVDSSIFRPATYVEKSVDNVARTALFAFLALAVALLVVFFQWRRAIVALLSVALSLMVAAWVIHLTGHTFNAIVVAGLLMAVVTIVRDAIVNVEDAERRLVAHRDSKLPSPPGASVVLSATIDTGRTALWGTVMLVVALVPLFLMHGLSGDSFFPPMAAACLVAVIASFVVAMTVTPALSLLLIVDRPAGHPSPGAVWLQRVYDRSLAPALRTPLPAVAAIAVAFLAASILVPHYHKALLPNLKDPNVLIHWSTPFGTSLPEMDRITARAAAELRALPGIRAVGAQVGQASLGDSAVGSDSAEMWVSIDPSADYSQTLGSVKQVVAGYPGVRHQVTTYARDKITRALSPTTDEITVRVFGIDLDVLQKKAAEIRDMLSGVKGVSNANMASPPAEPTMEIQVDLAKAKAVGIAPGEVRRAAATLLSGLRVGNLFEDQKVFDVMVWSTPASRNSLSSVQDLLIDSPSGDHVRMGDIADVRVRATPPSIEHQDISRFVDVTANVRGRSVAEVERQVTAQLKQLDYPLEYHAELVGDYSEQRDARLRLAAFAIAAALTIFLLLQAVSASWRVAAISFLLLPVALLGGAVAAWLDGNTVTLATVGGLLAVLALTLRNSIMLLRRYRTLRMDDLLPLGSDLVAGVARESMTPVVMSALCTAVVLVPAIVFGDIAGQEFIEPMAWVVLGGLGSATLVNLFLLPALYLRFAPRQEPRPLDFGRGVHEADQDNARDLAMHGAGVG